MNNTKNENKPGEPAKDSPASKPPNAFLHWLVVHGFHIMMTGFTIAAASAVALIMVHQHPGIVKTAILSAGCTGFGIYFVGRICVSIQRRANKSPRRVRAELNLKDGDDE